MQFKAQHLVMILAAVDWVFLPQLRQSRQSLPDIPTGTPGFFFQMTLGHIELTVKANQVRRTRLKRTG